MVLNVSGNRGSYSTRPEQVQGIVERVYLSDRLRNKINNYCEVINNHEQTIGGSRGFLFYGLPGTGKTTMVKYIAEKTKSNFFFAPLVSDPNEVTHVFDDARRCAKDEKKPSIILFDDMDYVGKRSEGLINTGSRPILASMFKEFNDVDNNKGVFWFVTTNHEDMLDEALRRAPRLTYEVEFPPPGPHERENILRAIVKDPAMVVKWNDETIKKIASITYGYVPADLYGLVQIATDSAVARKAREVSGSDIEYAKKEYKTASIRDMPYVEPTIKLEDMYGDYIQPHKELLSSLAVRIEDGCRLLLYGPSGYGKTDLILALAGTHGYNALYFNPSDIIDKFVGESGKILARMFRSAKNVAPCILIIDEAEGVVNPQNPYSQEWLTVLRTKTSEDIPGVMTVLIANNPSDWGNNMLTRFNRMYLPRADHGSMVQIIQKKLEKLPGSQVDAEQVARAMDGKFTPRALDLWIKTMKRWSARATTDLMLRYATKTTPPLETVDYDEVSRKVGNDMELDNETKNRGEINGKLPAKQ